jgi:hypothetical protein
LFLACEADIPAASGRSQEEFLLPWSVVLNRVVLVSLALLPVLGCAHAVRPEEVTPRYEHIYHKPVEEALAATRELMRERGYSFEEAEDANQLLTAWRQPVSGTRGNGVFERYLVVGIRVAARQSVVRIFHMRRAVTGNDVEVKNLLHKSILENKEWESNPSLHGQQFFQTASLVSLGGVAHGRRDLELEKVLALRLESGAGVETLGGNVREAPATPVTREPSFYLQRWKTDAEATASAEGPCPRQVRGLRELLRPGLTLLVGEQLGTRETPAVVGDMVCEAAARGLRVALGVSLPREEQARLEAYLASPGAPADQDALLRGDFWRKPHQDGRGSRAMMDLVDRVRSLRASGLPVSLVAFGVETSTGSERDMQMADTLLVRREKQREEVLVVLAGNVHMRLRQGVEWDEHFTPMAWHLARADRKLVALDLSYAPGSRWGCDLERGGTLRCGLMGATPHPRVAAVPGMDPSIRLLETRTEEGFHGLLYVGALSPSMPAASRTEGESPVPTSVPSKYIKETQGTILQPHKHPPIF